MRPLQRHESGDPVPHRDKRQRHALQEKQALVPACFGRGAFGDFSLGAYRDLCPASGFAEHGWRALSFRRPEDGSELHLSASRLTLTLSAEDDPVSAGGSFLDRSFGPAKRHAERVTPLSQLHHASAWTEGTAENPVHYSPGLKRPSAILAACHFAGDLTPLADSLSVADDQSYAAAVRLQDGLHLYERLGTTRATITIRVVGSDRLLWRAMSNPDAVLCAERCGGGNPEEALLETPCVLIYEFSAQQGRGGGERQRAPRRKLALVCLSRVGGGTVLVLRLFLRAGPLPRASLSRFSDRYTL